MQVEAVDERSWTTKEHVTYTKNIRITIGIQSSPPVVMVLVIIGLLFFLKRRYNNVSTLLGLSQKCLTG